VKKIPLALAASLLLFSSAALPQTLQDLIARDVPKSSGALGGGIFEALLKRGYTPTDPRIGQTISAVNRSAVLKGMTSSTKMFAKYLGPLGLMISLSEFAETIGPNADGTVGQNKPVTPGASGGLTQGGSYWKCGTYSSLEPYTTCLQYVTPQNTSADWALFEFYASNSTSTRIQYTYSLISPTYCKAGGCQKSTVYADYFSSGAPATCPSGYYHKSTVGCVQYNFKPFTQSKTFTDFDQYVSQLTETQKQADANTEMMRRLLNELWRQASEDPAYDGVPYDKTRPVTDKDLTDYKDRRPSDWPKWGDLPTLTPKPVENPWKNPDETSAVSPEASASAVVVRVDFGPDPGIKAPDLEAPPDRLFDPIKALMQPWTGWQVPSHSGECPTWYGAPSIGGYTFILDLSYHCQFVEAYRSAILAAAVACWAVIAVFIVLSA
jgi:hypothetical protein